SAAGTFWTAKFNASESDGSAQNNATKGYNVIYDNVTIGEQFVRGNNSIVSRIDGEVNLTMDVNDTTRNQLAGNPTNANWIFNITQSGPTTTETELATGSTNASGYAKHGLFDPNVVNCQVGVGQQRWQFWTKLGDGDPY
ncbi:MAG: hypothetical protein SVU32_06695, partial [Candidatus Nanohaloarchaea archaeon]|nr:hypothetical protein [Candidatus Nanohaloarchaea archaeon]